jgi:hypothetical protein
VSTTSVSRHSRHSCRPSCSPTHSSASGFSLLQLQHWGVPSTLWAGQCWFFQKGFSRHSMRPSPRVGMKSPQTLHPGAQRQTYAQKQIRATASHVELTHNLCGTCNSSNLLNPVLQQMHRARVQQIHRANSRAAAVRNNKSKPTH